MSPIYCNICQKMFVTLTHKHIWLLVITEKSLKPISQLRFDYDTTAIRCHDAFDYDGSDRNYDLNSIRLRYDYDTTTTKN